MNNIFTHLMEIKGVTKYRVSKETGISQTTLSDYEKGKYELKIDKLELLAEYFGVSIDYLRGLEQKEKPAAQGSEPDISFDDFTYAMYNEGKELTEADKEVLLSMARQLNEARKKKGS